MNREIKFRVFDLHFQEMCDVSLICFPLKRKNGFDIVEGHGVSGTPYRDITITEANPLLQSTGLKDKNGVDVYEGDIVLKCDPKYWREEDEEPDAEDLEFYRGGTAKVVITKYGVQMDEIDCGEWCFNGPECRDWNESELEVIGNIWQNPELL